MRVRLTLIGAGRVGQALGKLALKAGYEIVDVVCRSGRSATRAVAFIGGGKPQSIVSARPGPAHLSVIAVPDDSLAEVAGAWAERLTKSGYERRSKTAAIHTSGALPGEVLAPLRPFGIAIGSCHPLQTFADPDSGVTLAPGSYFCIEGERQAAAAASRLVRLIGGRQFEIPAESKGLYHAAAVIASGGLAALFATSRDALMQCGLDKCLAEKVLGPLIEGTLANVRRLGPARALTGPVSRGDVKTVERNLASLAAVDKQWREVYRVLTRENIRLAREGREPGPARDLALKKLQELIK